MPRIAAALSVACCWAAALAGQPLHVSPGGVVRWTGEGSESCAQGERVWAPAGDTCWFPVDLEATGELVLARSRRGQREELAVTVGPYPYPVQHLTVADSMVNLSAADAARAAGEAERIRALWQREGVPRFTLPLLPPLEESGTGRSFGARRFFNNEPRSPHSGVDYRAASGTPVRAGEAGTVALAEEHFFGGNSVFVDHGGGLVTAYLHLSTMTVSEGQRVSRGQIVGTVGATGRVTGPHLHFGVRWHGARVDPGLLLGRPEDVPEVVASGGSGGR